jgi:hypothetical protein
LASSKAFRPSVEQWELFCDIRDAVVGHKKQIAEAQSFLQRTYSISAIRARERHGFDRLTRPMLEARGMKREDALKESRTMRKPPEGWKRKRLSTKNATTFRLLQFIRDLADLDLTSESQGIRIIWAWRILYVAFLVTDPDAAEGGLPPDELLRTPWDERGSLGRWWARESAYGQPPFEHWNELTRLALVIIRRDAPKGNQRRNWLPEAVFLVRDHADWPDAKIAAAVGVSPSALSRSKEYKRAAALARDLGGGPLEGHVVVDPESGLHDIVGHDEEKSEGDGSD